MRLAIGTIDGRMLKDMIIAGASLLEKNRAAIDALNVFPVPDGDTGTNMSLTMMAAVRELNGADQASAAAVAALLARGSLRGARGNSGVILSQLWRGFAKGLEGVDAADAKAFAAALSNGVAMAYKAVMKPREGTILTVSRVVAEQAEVCAAKTEDLDELLRVMMSEGEAALRKTPDQLPVLKQAGVVDAGGKGLLVLYAGFRAALAGEDIDSAALVMDEAAADMDVQTEESITFAYCTEFIVQNCLPSVTDHDISALRRKLGTIGDCELVVGDPSIIKVHVHTNDPGKVLQLALKLGELAQIKIDNMRLQHRRLVVEDGAQEHEMEPTGELREVGVVAVAAGDGMAVILKDLAVDVIVEGGQTMNPSIDDIAKAIKRAHARNVLVLPNNGNVVLAAQQAADLPADCQVRVVPTKTVPQGVAAMVAFVPDQPLQVNVERMLTAAESVKTGQVTYAVRNSVWHDREIRQGDILGLADGEIVLVGSDVAAVAADLVALLAGEESLLTIFHGNDVSPADAEELKATIAAAHPGCDVEMLRGGQALYYYEFSVE